MLIFPPLDGFFLPIVQIPFYSKGRGKNINLLHLYLFLNSFLLASLSIDVAQNSMFRKLGDQSVLIRRLCLPMLNTGYSMKLKKEKFKKNLINKKIFHQSIQTTLAILRCQLPLPQGLRPVLADV